MSGWVKHMTSDGYEYYTNDEWGETTVPYKLNTLDPLTGGTANLTPREYAEYMARDLPGLGVIEYTTGTPPKSDLKPEVPGPFSAKAPMHALPLEKLESLARVLEYGNRKYAKDNWIGTANDPDRYIGAILRHLGAIRAGVMIDESGLPHVGHLMASVLILEEALRNAGILVTEYTK